MSNDLEAITKGGVSSELTVSPFYHSAVNAVTRPNQATWCSDYFIDRWMPLLGNEGTRIVLALRRRGYNNRKTGVKREEIKMDRAELAAMVGCSEDTVTREMGINKKTGKEHNLWLHLFVRKFEHKKRDPYTGRLWQETNGYFVAMDDPVHPEDWHLVAAYVAEQTALREKGKLPDHSPETHFAFPVVPPGTHFTPPETHFTEFETHFTVFETQNASRLIRESDSLLLLKTLKTPAACPEFSLALFPDQTEPPKSWDNLTETERAPYIVTAESELKRIYPERASKLNQRMIAVRAKSVFEQETKA